MIPDQFMAADLPRPRRVLMTADPLGGVWTYCLELASALGEAGVEFILLTMGAPLSQVQQNQIRELSNVELFESDYKLEWMDSPWEDVTRAGEWMLDMERCFRPDVIHLNGFSHGSLPWKAPKMVVAHSCVLSWWQAVKGEPAPASWKKYAGLVKGGLEAAEMIVAPSQAMLDELNRLYGPIKGKVIPNGRSASMFYSSQKEPFICSAGRLWDEAKNLSMLEKISLSVDWPIYVAGERRQAGSIVDCGHQKAAPGPELTFLGPLPPSDLVNWLARASIYVLPARYEPFGLSVLEAGLAGCALVLGDIPSLRENWSGAAIFANCDDPRAFRESVNRLIGRPEELQKWAALAQRRALQFTPGAMASAYYSAYQLLMSENERKKVEVVCA